MTGRARTNGEELFKKYGLYCDSLAIKSCARARRLRAAASFLARYPVPAAWMRRPLGSRLKDLRRLKGSQCFIAFALASAGMRADIDFLLCRSIPELGRTVAGLHRGELSALGAAALRLALSEAWTRLVLAEMLPIAVAACGKTPGELHADDLGDLGERLASCRSLSNGRRRRLLSELRSLSRMAYEAGTVDRPAPARKGRPRTDRLGGVTTIAIYNSIASYLDARAVVLRPSTVYSLTTNLAVFGEFCSQRFPEIRSLAQLERPHIEAYCSFSTNRPWRSKGSDGRPVGPAAAAHALVSLRSFLDDISAWGWPDAPSRRLVFSSDIPRPPKLLPRALPPHHDAALMAEVGKLTDRFAADGLTILRGTGLRIGELLDLELSDLVDYADKGCWLKVPLGKLNDERTVPIDGHALSALEDWLVHRAPCRALPRPRDGRSVDFIFVEHGQRLDTSRLNKGLHEAAAAAGLASPDGSPARIVVHQLRHTYATSLLNAGVSLPALMALLGHRSPEMTLRYATLSSPTLRRAYEEAMGKIRPRIPLATFGRPAMGDKVEWLAAETLKTRLAHGYCARELVAEACPYANICENCASFVTTPEFTPILENQLADVCRLRDDAKTKGWESEVSRHQRTIDSLEGHLRRLRS